MKRAVRPAALRLLSAFLLSALCPAALPQDSEDTTAVWARWEHRLLSDRDYPLPCVEVSVRVRFEGPDGETRTGMAFWDGGNAYVIRHTFPKPGDWRWTTECSDTSNRSLQRTGVVRVEPARGDNPLTQHGHLRVSEDGRTLAFADGTPFLWIGDTCWAAPVHATREEWNHYLDSRVKKGYTLLQMAIAPEWALKRSRKGIPPFLSALPDITQPNPAFFQELDRMLDAANDRGLAVLLCGLMETPYEYPPAGQIAVFSRYVAARYGSHAVLFSPSFDSGIHETETLASAASIREAAPASLVTMHMGTGVGPHFHAADWLSFDMYQSGHNGGDAARQSARAIGMPAEILALAPRKPIINGEAIYEGELGGAYGVRRTAWLSFLSGAVGYTGGIDEVYAWEPDVTTMMDAPSSDQIAVLATFLRAVPWWSLDSEPRRILNQPDDRARLMAFAMNADRELGIAYLPANEMIALNLNACSPVYDAIWIHASTGRVIGGPRVDSMENTLLAAPGPEDWALLLAAPDTVFTTHVREALRGVEFTERQTTVSMVFREDAPLDGLVRKTSGDGAFVYTTHEGVRCIVNDNPARNAYLYLDLDDRLVFRGGLQSMVVGVKLRSDEPLDGVQLQYDAGGPPGTENAYHGVPPSRQSQEDGWTHLEFVADSPFCGNRQNSGADFRVYLAGHRCHIASVKVRADAG